MPTISTPSKLLAPKAMEPMSSSRFPPDEEIVVADVIRDTRRQLLVPPYDHPNIMWQGTGMSWKSKPKSWMNADWTLLARLGGGGMLSGVATALYGTGIRVFGSEPSWAPMMQNESNLASVLRR